MTYHIRKLKCLPLVSILAIGIFTHPVFSQISSKIEEAVNWNEIIRNIAPALTTITTYNSNGDIIHEGSGFVLKSDGLIITAYHLIQMAHQAQITTASGDKYDVQSVVYADRAKDFAILKISAIDLSTVVLGDSSGIELGENVLALGDSKRHTVSISLGIVSSKAKEVNGSTWIQATAPAFSENSGGPLLNQRGEAVGVISLAAVSDTNSTFAVPINYVRGAIQAAVFTNHKLSELARIDGMMEVQKKKQAADNFIKSLKTYEDPDHNFKLMIPKDWNVQRSEKENVGDGLTVIETLFSPPNTRLVESYGYLSEGIRITIVFPSDHPFTLEELDLWKNSYPRGVLMSNIDFELTSTSITIINGRHAWVYKFQGKGDQVSEFEQNVHYVLGNRKAIVQIETISPLSKVGSFEPIIQKIKDMELSVLSDSLSLAEIEKLISHTNSVTLKVLQDSAISVEIITNGVNFRITVEILSALKKLGAGPKTIDALTKIGEIQNQRQKN